MTGMTCRFCGSESEHAVDFDAWVKPTFTDHDKLLDGDVVCQDCLFWFDERSEELAALVGKDKPQRMRNYSHFVVNGEWIPLSKGDKQRMQDILLGALFPELAAIAESGQKHIVFRATRNALGSSCGWVQFEEQSLFVQPQELKDLLDAVEALYAHFSKKEIRTGNYKPYLIMPFGIERWYELENQIKPQRGGLLFSLALFLAQRREDGRSTRKGEGVALGGLAGDTARLQKDVPPSDMADIPERNSQCSTHDERVVHVRQLALFEIKRSD